MLFFPSIFVFTEISVELQIVLKKSQENKKVISASSNVYLVITICFIIDVFELR